MTKIHSVCVVIVTIGAVLGFHAHSFAQDSAKADLDSLYSKGSALRGQGLFDEAIIVLQKALILSEKLHGKDDVETARVVMQLGLSLRGAGRPRDAEPHYRRVLHIREARLGKDDFLVGQTLANLGNICHDLARFEEAEDSYRRALKIYEARRPADHIDFAWLLGNFGLFLSKRSKLEEGETLLRRGLHVLEVNKQADTLQAAQMLDGLVNNQLKQERLAEADRLFRREVQILQARHGADSLPVAIALNKLGSLNQDIANYQDADRFFRRSLEIFEKKRVANHVDIAVTLNNLANVEIILGRASDAEAHFLRSMKMHAARGKQDGLEMANVLNNLASLYQGLERSEQARGLFQRSLEIREAKLGKDHLVVANSLNSLGSLYLDLAEYKKAEEHLRRALRICEAHGKDSFEVSVCLNNLAGVYLETNRIQEADAAFRRCLEIVEARRGKEHPALMTTLRSLCKTSWRLGRRQEAEELLERCLQIARVKLGEEHGATTSALVHRAWLRQGLKRSADALADEEQCLRICQANMQRMFSFASEQAMLASLDASKGALPSMLDLAVHADERPPAAVKAYAWTLRLKGTALDALCRYRQAQHLVAPDDALAGRVARYRVLKQLQASAALSPPQGLKPADLKEQMMAWHNETEIIEAELNRAFAKKHASQLGDIGNLSAEHVQRQLAPGTALVEYVRAMVLDYEKLSWSGSHYYAFVLTPDRNAVQLIDLGPAEPIEAGVRAVRAQFTEFQEKLAECETREEMLALEKSQEKTFRAASAGLHKKVLAPLQNALGNAKVLYIAADGELNRLPFSALVDADGKYLIETQRCAYLSSGRDLMRKPARAAQGTVVFAGPDFKADTAERQAQAEKVLKKGTSRGGSAPNLRSKGWAPLPGAAAEAKTIRALLHEGPFGPVTTYTGAAASEDILKAMPAPRVLHLATHGYYLDREWRDEGDGADAGAGAGWARGRLKQADNPLLRSGIVLAGANTIGDKDGLANVDDGWVTAEEISLLNLQGTELVVLSACQTGLGDIKTGEGVYGLRRAFLYAGARTLVTSLFEVPDRETSALMNRFYGGLKNGQGKLAALHSAQNEMRRSRAAAGAAHPFYWASFVLVGSPD